LNDGGIVDAADYVGWRKTDSTPADYDTWHTHFGESIGSGSSNNNVPEPTSLAMFILAATPFCTARWRR
jgi:hypothetical protein